jgi:hypothetical protein
MATAYIYKSDEDIDIEAKLSESTELVPTDIASAWTNEVTVTFAAALSADDKTLLDEFMRTRYCTYLRTEETSEAIELYVDPAGSDNNDGLSPASAFQTIQFTMDRVDFYIGQGQDRDIVVHVGDGTYAEDVVWTPTRVPRRRIILKADRLSMTSLASGTLTAATPVLFTDGGAAFGAANQYAGKLLRLSTGAGTEISNTQIRSHTGTAIKPCQTMTAAPAVGWLYDILEPSAKIRSFTATLPWVSGRGFNALKGSKKPALIFEWLGFGPAATAVYVYGGEVTFVGCEANGAGGGDTIRMESATCNFGQLYGDVADPDTDNPSAFDFDITYTASIGILGSHVDAMRADAPGLVAGFPVAKGAGSFLFSEGPVFWQIFGGALHDGGGLEAADGGFAMVDGGFDASLGFLVKNNVSSSFAFRSKGGSMVGTNSFGTGGVELSGLSADAFLADQQSKMDVKGVTSGAGDVPGVGIQASTDSQIRVDAAVTFPTGGNNLVADDGTSTFAGLTPAAPVVGAAVLTGSRIWEG